MGWIVGATAVNASLIALVTMLMQLPGQQDQVITLAILALVVLLAFSIVLPLVGHRAEEKRRRREEQDEHSRQVNALLAAGTQGNLPRLQDVTNEQLGATPTRYTRQGSAPYIVRSTDDAQLRNLLGQPGPPYPFVLVWGPTKAGKSRILAEAVRATLPAHTQVLVPLGGQQLAELTQLGLPIAGDEPGLVVLDDLTPADLEALTTVVLDTVLERALLVATMTAKRRRAVLASGSEVTRVARAALERADNYELEFRPPTAEELSQARELYPAERFRGSIAETLVGGVELIAKYRAGQDDNPAGCALVRAAVDCRRAGLNRPISDSELRRLFPIYLPMIQVGMPASTEQYNTGLTQWAAVPVASQVALLTRTVIATSGQDGWDVLDHVVSADEGTDHAPRPIPVELWPELLDFITPRDALNISFAAYDRQHTDHAITAFRKASTSTQPDQASMAACALGILLQEQGDTDGARAAYQLAIDSGHPDHGPTAAYALGVLLEEQGNADGARTAYQHAIDS
ncbi:tetratricopeptide repeat protein, partial [Nonomuraea sp. NPDC004186]